MDLLEVKNLSVFFSIRSQILKAVRSVSFSLKRDETIGIVGESGSGKSALIQAIAQLSEGDVSGEIFFEGKKTRGYSPKIGVVFQDPMGALNPTMKIGKQMIESVVYHKMMGKKEAIQKAIELLDFVGISEPKIRLHHYPHQMSGGMRQRVLIAMALISNPSLILFDEPTTALDKATEKQVLDLLQKIRREFQMSSILVSHDLDVIEKCSDKVFVMYAGKIVERKKTALLQQAPEHPYTQLLMSARPKKLSKEPLPIIQGDPPNPLEPIQGCPFAPRCPYRAVKCKEEPQGDVACWRAK